MCATPQATSMRSPENSGSAWLDRDRVLETITRYVHLPVGWRISQLSVLRVYPTKKATFGAQYHLRLCQARHGQTEGFVYLSPNTSRALRESTRPKINPAGAFVITGLLLPVEGGAMLLHTPDRDPQLPSLQAASSSRLMVRTLGLEYAPRCRCLSYRPGRRCTLAYVDPRQPDRFVVGKVFGNGIYETTPEVHRRVRDALRREVPGSIEVPRPLKSIESLRMVVFSGVATNGTSRHEDLSQAAGRVLAALHRIRGVADRHFSPSDESHTIHRWATLVERLRPSDPMPRGIRGRLKSMSRRLPRTRSVFLHRDFYDAQLLATPRGWAVVDLDTACVGDRELDVANYISHHLWKGVLADSLRTARRESAEFLRSYLIHKGGVRRLNAHRTQYYLVGSLARVSLIHSLRTGQESAARTLMEIAGDLATLSAKRCYQTILSPEE